MKDSAQEAAPEVAAPEVAAPEVAAPDQTAAPTRKVQKKQKKQKKTAGRSSRARATKKAIKAPRRGRPKGSKNKVRRTRKVRVVPNELSIEQLEKQLARRKDALVKEQNKQRAALAAQIEKIDAAMEALGLVEQPKRRKARKGSAAKSNRKSNKARKGGGRRSNGQTLPDFITKVLKRKRNGMSVKDIAAAVGKSGYKSSSKNLYPMISQALRDRKRFTKVARGTYAVK